MSAFEGRLAYPAAIQSVVVLSASAFACWTVIHVATGGWPMGALFAAATTTLVLGGAVRIRATELAVSATALLLFLVAVGSSAELRLPAAAVVGLAVGAALFALGYVLADRAAEAA